MHEIGIRKQIEYLALARRKQHAAKNPTFEEGVQRKAKTTQHQIKELPKQA